MIIEARKTLTLKIRNRLYFGDINNKERKLE